MAIGVGNLVSAADYNAIYNTVRKVLGDDGVDVQVGYGRTLASSAVSIGDVIDSTLLDNLYADLVKARTHQLGTSFTWATPADGINAPDTGEYIGAFAADIGTGGTSADATADEAEGFLDFSQAAADILADKYAVGSDQTSILLADQATRTTAWNGSIIHTVDLVFANANERRYFFNSGGLAIFTASLTGGNSVAGDQTQTYPDTPAYQKDEIWQTMLNNMGTIYFGRNNTAPTGTGSGAAIGNYQLTSAYQTIFTKSGSGVYSENFYKIEAKGAQTSNKITFKITFSDVDAGDNRDADAGFPGEGTPVDENVTGTITSTIQTRAATGALGINHPGASATSSLGGGAATDSYILTANSTSITEGDTVTISLQTTNVPDGNIPYSITGIAGGDLSSGSLTGNFALSGGFASLNFTLADDGVVENSETMTMTLNNGRANISITIADTGVVAPTYAITNPNPNVIDEGSLTTTGPFYGNGYGASWVFSSPDYFLFITWNGNSVYSEIYGNQPQEGDTFIGNDGATYTIGAFQSAYNYAVSRTVPTPGSGTFTVATTNVPNGTVLYWTISHLTTSDADFDAVQGTVTINNNAGSINVNTIPDATTEGQESFILRLREGSYTGTIVASGGTGTTVGDTSTTPAPSISGISPFGDVYVYGFAGTGADRGAGTIIRFFGDGDIHKDSRGNDGIYNTQVQNTTPVGTWLPSGRTADEYEIKVTTSTPTNLSISNSTGGAFTAFNASATASQGVSFYLPSTVGQAEISVNLEITIREIANTAVSTTFTGSGLFALEP